MRLFNHIGILFRHPASEIHQSIQLRNFAKVLYKPTVSNRDTFTGRILLYLNIDKEKYSPPTLKNVNNTPEVLNNLQKLQLPELLSLLNAFENRDPPKIQILKKLDTECCERLSKLSSGDILQLLKCFMGVIPNYITELKFYELALSQLGNMKEDLCKNDFVQLIFYVGMQKKNIKSQRMLRSCMTLMDKDFINSLTVEELCIICNSFFRTSTKINNRVFLNTVKNTLSDNLYILKDPALFMTLIKVIRHNKYQDDDLLATISCAIFFNKTLECYSFTALCHILALYADFLYYDEKIINFFTKKGIQQIKDSVFTSKRSFFLEHMRAKDIKRFIWALSMFSAFHPLDGNDIKTVLVPKILERAESGEFDQDVDSLVDIILYLWMLNHRAYELVPYALTKEKIQLLGK